MRGHEPLIAMRRAGKVPGAVFIDVDVQPNLRPVPAMLQWQHVNPTLVDIEIAIDEPIHRLDLRFLIGLTVHVSGCEHHRVEGVRDACIAAQARRVIASFMVKDHSPEGYSVAHITDTEGHFHG